MRTTEGLTRHEKAHYDEHGYVRLAGFADPGVCRQMLDRALGIARGEGSAGLVLPEANLADGDGAPEDRVSKVFGLHRDGVFGEFAASRALTDLLVDLIGPSVDCFLSQFVFKSPGAWGQPWHQDSFYFPFDPPRPIVGVSLAVTEATAANGCLHVVPGSHREDVHEHVPDSRPGANYGYVEIAGRDMSGAVPMLMQPGDMLVFDSHLIHRSADNVTDTRRGAMTYHFAATGTVDLGRGIVNDFVTVR